MENNKPRRPSLDPIGSPERNPQNSNPNENTRPVNPGHVNPDTLPSGPDIVIPTLPGEGGGR